MASLDAAVRKNQEGADHYEPPQEKVRAWRSMIETAPLAPVRQSEVHKNALLAVLDREAALPQHDKYEYAKRVLGGLAEYVKRNDTLAEEAILDVEHKHAISMQVAANSNEHPLITLYEALRTSINEWLDEDARAESLAQKVA